MTENEYLPFIRLYVEQMETLQFLDDAATGRAVKDILRYAQANGGSVILHAPVTQNTLRAEELEDRLTVAICNYFRHGV